MSRSGGTLMVTILDAHPDVAMSYELYPSLLEQDDASPDRLRSVADQIDQEEDFNVAMRDIEPKNFRTYLLRCKRSGLDHHELAALLRQHAAESDFSDLEGRMRFMEHCCLAKMRKLGKRRWGVKCTTNFEDFRALWPGAYFLCMLRDGRDILASQQNTGAFTDPPEKVAHGWVRTQMLFRDFVNAQGTHAYEVRYEQLVDTPEEEIRAIASSLDLEFDPRMLDYHHADLTVFGASHLSMDRITKPIDQSRVGRWHEDLSDEDLKRFYAEAGDSLTALGYTVDG